MALFPFVHATRLKPAHVPLRKTHTAATEAVTPHLLKGNDMSAPIKALLAATALFAVATPALAQDAAPWDLRERNAYVLDMQGKMWSTQKIGPKGWAMMTRSAKAVPRGTVFFMQDGRLMMARAGMFDRAGGFGPMNGL
jgi:hypothetical protein